MIAIYHSTRQSRILIQEFIEDLLKKVFRGGRVWGVGCRVWGFTDFEVVSYLIFREKVQGFCRRSLHRHFLREKSLKALSNKVFRFIQPALSIVIRFGQIIELFLSHCPLPDFVPILKLTIVFCGCREGKLRSKPWLYLQFSFFYLLLFAFAPALETLPLQWIKESKIL